MATIDARKNKRGEIIGYRLRACLGRDEQYKQIWRTCRIERPEGLTPAKERKEVERLASEWEKQQKDLYDKDHPKEDKTKITFADFVRKRWWTSHVMDGTHTPSSIEFYGYMSSDILQYFGDTIKLKSIDAEAVKHYLNFLNNEATTRRGEPLSRTTVQHHFGTLRTILQYAARYEYIEKDPTQKLTQKEKPHRDAKKVDFLASDDARRFLRCLDDEPLFWKCFMNVLIVCGLRRGECIGLQWGDLDDQKLTLTISRNITLDANAPNKLHEGEPKNGKSRTVPISARVYGLLMQLKNETEERLHITMAPSAYIFCRQSDPKKPIYPTEPTRFMSKFIKRHNLPDVSPHDLRHTAASLALESGADLKQVQELLGHADPATTMKFYVGLSEETQRRTTEGIESLIG